MTKLNQVVAVVAGRKTATQKVLSELYKLIQKPILFDGLSRYYKPLDEEKGDRLPPEIKVIQENATNVLEKAKASLQELWDSVATQDESNCKAKADITVDGKVLVKDVPVTTLMYLEKQLEDLATFLQSLPVLSADESWTFNENQGYYQSEPSSTVRTKKEPRVLVKYDATDKHPAQTEVIFEDMRIGEYTATKCSSALPRTQRDEFVRRVNKVKDAVKIARESANDCVVVERAVAAGIFEFVFKSN